MPRQVWVEVGRVTAKDFPKLLKSREQPHICDTCEHKSKTTRFCDWWLTYKGCYIICEDIKGCLGLWKEREQT